MPDKGIIMTLNNTEYGLTVTITLVARGWLVRMVDDNGVHYCDRIFPTESAALAYAHKIAGVDQ